MARGSLSMALFKGEKTMKMPSKISTWCLVLYFLWLGLSAFVPALAGMGIVGSLLALGAAVTLFLDK